jgi:hypothetical protein
MKKLVYKLEGKYSIFSLLELAMLGIINQPFYPKIVFFLKLQSISPLAYKKHKPYFIVIEVLVGQSEYYCNVLKTGPNWKIQPVEPGTGQFTSWYDFGYHADWLNLLEP